ncbi:MAG: class II D-tagatose-bisphosphate aldolase, non-catalytic subunit [Oscillospiraceae bacterium]|nr:class II D-tagatose-bisphosphate aldolase, non-catalytic subunit [Oscillospiraceae bacterium]
MHPIRERFQKKGMGVFSVCSANELVLRAAMRHARKNNYLVIVESTANQVDQFGGYTGMRPKDFVDMVGKIAAEEKLPAQQLVLGGDHLGPLTFAKWPEDKAMELSQELVAAYVKAGYTKIHLDTSMRVASDDPDQPLDVRVCARRGARLAKTVYESLAEYRRTKPDAVTPVLVIGSEVPIPGGSHEHEDSIVPTSPEDFRSQVQAFRDAFAAENVPFEDVVGFVVQPGVEFGDDFVFRYDAQRAASLTAAIRDYPELVFEGHSTDYQTGGDLAAMVRDRIAILKVGPALTFGLREALLLLELIEKEMVTDPAKLSRFRETLVSRMNAEPKYWKSYYCGTEEEIAYKKIYSYSDRCRYYLPDEQVNRAVEKLLSNLADVQLPAALVSQYFPTQYQRMMSGELEGNAMDILLDRLGQWNETYAVACRLMEA